MSATTPITFRHPSNAIRVWRWLAVVLFAKVMVSILYEYRWYFPPNFIEADFLAWRESHFLGAYAWAFYAHIVSGPMALLNAVFLMFSGDRFTRLKLHRWMGRLQILLVSLLCVSGVVMARRAFAGPIAGVGFVILAALTMATAAASAYYAITKKIVVHRQWATRCFILLCSPLLLRLISGAAIVLRVESESIYRLNAWFSWLIPLAIYEAVLLFPSAKSTLHGPSIHSSSRPVSQATNLHMTEAIER